MSKRSLVRIDYAVLHSEGNIVPKAAVTTVQVSGSTSITPTESAQQISQLDHISVDTESVISSNHETTDSLNTFPAPFDDVDDVHSVTTQSSNESTLTPTSSDTELNDTLV